MTWPTAATSEVAPGSRPARSSEVPRAASDGRWRRRSRRGSSRSSRSAACRFRVTVACRRSGRRRGRRAAPTPARPAARRRSGIPNACSRGPRRSGRPRTARPPRPGPPASTSAWSKPGGISSRWCETRTIPAGRGVAGQRGQVGEQRLARGEVEAGGRLVEQEQVRVRHQRPGDRDAPPLAGGQRPERLVRDRRHPDPRRARPGRGPGPRRRTRATTARWRRCGRVMTRSTGVQVRVAGRPRRHSPRNRSACRSSRTSTLP